MVAPVFLSLSLLFLADEKPATYPNPNLLVEINHLEKLLAEERPTRLLDARAKDKYAAGHVAGAVSVDAAAWAKAFAEGQDPDAWAKRLGDVAVTPTTCVIVYDDNQSRDAARIWYILRYWGVKDVRLLNGGLAAWKANGGKTTDESTGIPKPQAVEVKKQPARLATKDELLKLLKDKPPQIIDARSTGEYCGTQETAKRNGAIPGAKHLEWSDTLDKKTGRFKSADELAKLFKDAGIDPSKPAVTYCQSGGRAAVLAFTLELMGGQDVSNYYRSWAEWGNDPDTPVEKPSLKTSPR
jgi:thiosulfate/3-mercaptopyruvate sulfurtransferase